jgi:DNA-binding NarL/FixJ family response regulator
MHAAIIQHSSIIVKRLKKVLSMSPAISGIDIITESRFLKTHLLENKPEIIIIESGLDGKKSLQLVKQIKKINSRIIIIVLAASSDVQYKSYCLASGANFILDIHDEFDQLPLLINTLMRSEHHVKQPFCRTQL